MRIKTKVHIRTELKKSNHLNSELLWSLMIDKVVTWCWRLIVFCRKVNKTEHTILFNNCSTTILSHLNSIQTVILKMFQLLQPLIMELKEHILRAPRKITMSDPEAVIIKTTKLRKLSISLETTLRIFWVQKSIKASSTIKACFQDEQLLTA